MEERKSNNGTVELRCHLSDIRIEQREGDTGGRTVTGYAAKFESWSEPICGWFVEQIRRGAFDECDTSDAIMCFNHNVNDILARTSSGTLTLAVDEVGLRFAFEAPGHDPRQRHGGTAPARGCEQMFVPLHRGAG